MTQATFLFASRNDTQTLYLQFVDGVCNWKAQLGEKGYHGADIHRKALIRAVCFDYSLNDDVECELAPADAEKANLLHNFQMSIELPDDYGPITLTNNDGVLTVGVDDDAHPIIAMHVSVETTYYLGDFGVEGIEDSEDKRRIVMLRAFLHDLDQPVYVPLTLPEAGEATPWIGLFNEAVHKVRAMCKTFSVDRIQYSGDAPSLVVKFFENAQKEEAEWFWSEIEVLGHAAMTLAYDEARHYLIQAIGNPKLAEWRDCHVALYQMFSWAMKETMDGLREPFFKHIRAVYRKHKEIQEHSPSVGILLEAYYDFDYLNIYQGVRSGTERYMQYLETTVRSELQRKMA